MESKSPTTRRCGTAEYCCRTLKTSGREVQSNLENELEESKEFKKSMESAIVEGPSTRSL